MMLNKILIKRLGPYNTALVAAPGGTAARRVNCKIGKIYSIVTKATYTLEEPQ